LVLLVDASKLEDWCLLPVGVGKLGDWYILLVDFGKSWVGDPSS